MSSQGDAGTVAGLEQHAGTGYLAVPDAGRGPAILVLHPWWGLNDDVHAICDRLAEAGYVALAPDLFDGAVTDDVIEGERLLATADPNQLAHLTRSSLATLRSLDITDDAPAGVLGLSMGASLALWLAARVPQGIAATVVFYGAQDIDLAASDCSFLGHFADVDQFVPDDDLVLMESDLRLLERDVEFHRYPGTKHWFVEPSRPEHDPAAAALAWDRTLAFLDARLKRDSGGTVSAGSG